MKRLLINFIIASLFIRYFLVYAIKKIFFANKNHYDIMICVLEEKLFERKIQMMKYHSILISYLLYLLLYPYASTSSENDVNDTRNIQEMKSAVDQEFSLPLV